MLNRALPGTEKASRIVVVAQEAVAIHTFVEVARFIFRH